MIDYLSDYTGFDFLWEPVPWQAHQQHVWPSQWHQYSGTYLVPKNGSTELNFHSEIIPNRRSDDNFNFLVKGVEFDTTWCPHPLDPPYIYVFGNQWWPGEIMPTVEYRVPGATERKFVSDVVAQLPECHDNHWHTLVDCEWDYSWVPDPGDPPYIYVFGNQWWSAVKMPTVEYHVVGATKRKYMAYPRANLLPDATNWEVPDSIDKSTIDFSWRPDPGAPPYIYQFATQHQRTGGPRYIVSGATDVYYIDQIKTQSNRTAATVCIIDHLNKQVESTKAVIEKTIPVGKTSRYFDNYLDTLRRIAASISDDVEYIWVCSSICDYTNFDFSWHPEQWQSNMLHVFASDNEKFGDTFFMHVPSFKEKADKCQLLEWYDLNFVDGISVPRLPIPVVKHSADTHVDAVKASQLVDPLVLFTTETIAAAVAPSVSLWREKTKVITPLDAGACSVIVPKSAIPYIKTQLYDYPYIDQTYRNTFFAQPLDIVFISNGETNAEKNWRQLEFAAQQAERIVRVDGINGRVAAYRAAAEASTTPWFFAVFAKLAVDIDFDWTWQPDRMQQPKHYIFHALNPVNNLEYGHQAMIAYNKKLVLENTAAGLDFTLDQAHEVVPIMSGVAEYDYDPWMTWRTAFREGIKLMASLPDVESEYRLMQWLNVGYGSNGHWSMIGAQDAVDYYNEVKGDPVELRKSYEWDWLASYAMLKHNFAPDQ